MWKITKIEMTTAWSGKSKYLEGEEEDAGHEEKDSLGSDDSEEVDVKTKIIREIRCIIFATTPVFFFHASYL